MKKQENAFPDQQNKGLTKLEYFAAKAMQSRVSFDWHGYPTEIAKRSFNIAEAMILESKTRTNK